MNLIEQIKADLEKGYSKVDLERLIGLPQNSLSGVIAGTKTLSKKSELKIEKFMVSEKPHPLTLIAPKKKVEIRDLTKPTKQVKAITNHPETSNVTIDTTPKDLTTEELIKQLEKERDSITGKSTFASDVRYNLQKRIDRLKRQNS